MNGSRTIDLSKLKSGENKDLATKQGSRKSERKSFFKRDRKVREKTEARDSSFELYVGSRKKEDKNEGALNNEIKEKHEKKSRKSILLKLFVFLIILIAAAGGGFYYYYQNSKLNYIGSWTGTVSADETSEGIKSITYNFSNDSVEETLDVTKKQGLKAQAKISYSLRLDSQDTGSIKFKGELKESKIENVTYDSSACSQATCDNMKKDFEDTFNKTISEESKDFSLQLRKISDDKLQFVSSVEGARILTKK